MMVGRAACTMMLGLAVSGVALSWSGPAMAQFGGLFDPPPRPPTPT